MHPRASTRLARASIIENATGLQLEVLALYPFFASHWCVKQKEKESRQLQVSVYWICHAFPSK
jgi:hypothetical protein